MNGDDTFPYDTEEQQIGSGDVGNPDTGFMPVGFSDLGGMMPVAMPAVPRGPGQRGYNFGRSMGRIVMRSGRYISTTKAYQLMRQWGPEIAAGALGSRYSRPLRSL